VITTAWAANSPLNGSHGGGIALAIIIGAGLTFLFLYVGHKKWQRRKLARHAGDD
jgi:hypothetical protein